MVEAAPSRHKTEAKIKSRLNFLDRLYQDCISGKYRQDHDDAELPLINIGRIKQISIEDGRHRICVAKVADLTSIPVKINAVHSELRDTLLHKSLEGVQSKSSS